MRLKAEQLPNHLKQHGLASVFCISGDEPLQLLESADQIRAYARNNGFDERLLLNVDRGFDWNQLRDAGANLSLFSSKRLIELRLGDQKPGREGGAALTDYVSAPAPDNVLLITMARIDKQGQQTKWYRALDKAGVTIQIWPVEAARLPAWISNRARLLDKRISQEAAALIADRMEGNLLAAKQELDKLCLLVDAPEISIDDVMDAVTDSTRFDVFSMIEFALAGKTDRILRMIRGLRNEGVEPMGIFGALMWEFRRLCSMSYEIKAGAARDRVFAQYRVWPQRKPAITAMLNRVDNITLGELLHQATELDRALKGAYRADPWELMENFLFRIAGVRLQSFSSDTIA
jgi:DNA polymerase-3 subunit delta